MKRKLINKKVLHYCNEVPLNKLMLTSYYLHCLNDNIKYSYEFECYYITKHYLITLRADKNFELIYDIMFKVVYDLNFTSDGC